MKITILVAAHKTYPMPTDPLYLPIQAGAALHDPLPYTPDSTGDNISEKNGSFCELTVLYWAWKNLPAEEQDYLGLCHYRRYFGLNLPGPFSRVKSSTQPEPSFLPHNHGASGSSQAPDSSDDSSDNQPAGISKALRRILTLQEAQSLLSGPDAPPVLLPRRRNYFIETGYSQYAHAHHERDLILTRTILGERCPDYVPAFDRTLARTTGHRFNMLIMRRDILDRYCAWLFDVLFELEKRADIADYSAYDQRVCGFIGERLLDVWLETNRIPYRELPVVHTESQHWLRKGTAFLKRKIEKGKAL